MTDYDAMADDYEANPIAEEEVLGYCNLIDYRSWKVYADGVELPWNIAKDGVKAYPSDGTDVPTMVVEFLGDTKIIHADGSEEYIT